jgi:hypothetical protein
VYSTLAEDSCDLHEYSLETVRHLEGCEIIPLFVGSLNDSFVALEAEDTSTGARALPGIKPACPSSMADTSSDPISENFRATED